MKKIAVVTGASSGMGKEFVLQLSRYVTVDEIWVIARRRQALEALAGESTLKVRPVVLDLGREESFETYRKLLVNAVGFGTFGNFRDIPPEDDCKMIDLNCKALVMMTRLTLPYMTQGCHILQLDSLSAFQPVPYITTYGATKAFVLSYTRSLNRELRGTGIRCMALNPGWVKTEFFDHAFQTNGSKVQYFDRLYKAADVVADGLRYLYKSKKEYWVPGFMTRMQVRLVKLLPHNIVMDIWCSQQKKAKNNHGLTTK